MSEQDLLQPSRKITVKKIIGLLLLLALAAVFVLSGISKLYDLEAFEWSFIDLGLSNFTLAAAAARTMIGLELLIALFLLAHLFLRKFTYPLTITLLIIFTIYLILLLVNKGNEGNCGCFGKWVYINPLQSIYKNLLMIAVAIVLYIIYPAKPYKQQQMVALFAGMAAIATPFIVNPLGLGTQPKETNKQINLSPLYKADTTAPSIDLRTGKHIVAFMSLTCPHCRKAAYLLQVIHRQHPDIPIFFVLAGPPEQTNKFFEDTHSIHVPHIMFFHRAEEFMSMAGDSVPAILWINNGIIEKESNYFQLDPQYMEDWLHESAKH